MPQLARWLTFIEEFDYEVVHRKGRSHANADGLSRIRPKKPNEDTEPKRDLSENMWTEEESSVREDLAEKQQSDPEFGLLVKLRLQSEQGPTIDQISTEAEGAKRLWNQWERLEVHAGRIYRRAEGRPGELTFRQLLVPRQLVQDVIRSCHEGQTGGHFGINRTLDQVRRRFYWTSRKADTIRFCKRCDRCNEYHRGKRRRTGPLQPVITGAPYERWYIDLTGPHPKSDRGNVYIFTCIDSFTKWAEAFPLRNKETETVAKVLVEQVFCRFGTPVSVLSDRGKEVEEDSPEDKTNGSASTADPCL